MSPSEPSAPPLLALVQQAERIQIIDILRGFALFGILVVNMAIFSRPFQTILFPADPAAHRRLFRKLLVVGLIVGLAGNALYATLIMSAARFEPSGSLALATVAQGIGAPLLSLAYISAICLLALRPAWQRILQVLAPVGQMALTNYLLESIIATLIFYGYGLGLFGQVGSALGLVLTVVIFLLLIPFSHWWMKRFRYGPAEWLWRSMTYLKRQPMRRS